MTTNKTRYTPDEFATKGDEFYQNSIQSKLTKDHHNQIIAIDIETGEFELADSTLAAAAKMFERKPDAQLWFKRIGAEGVHRFTSVRPACILLAS